MAKQVVPAPVVPPIQQASIPAPVGAVNFPWVLTLCCPGVFMSKSITATLSNAAQPGDPCTQFNGQIDMEWDDSAQAWVGFKNFEFGHWMILSLNCDLILADTPQPPLQAVWILIIRSSFIAPFTVNLTQGSCSPFNYIFTFGCPFAAGLTPPGETFQILLRTNP